MKRSLTVLAGIVLLLVATVAYQLITLENSSHSGITGAAMKSLMIALEDCKRICGRYPTTAEGLETLLEGHELCKVYTPLGPQFRENLHDAWGNPFIYTSDGHTYRLLSAGHKWIESAPGTEPTEVERPE